MLKNPWRVAGSSWHRVLNKASRKPVNDLLQLAGDPLQTKVLDDDDREDPDRACCRQAAEDVEPRRSAGMEPCRPLSRHGRARAEARPRPGRSRCGGLRIA